MAKEVITVRMDSELLDQIDKAAAEMNMNRTEYMLAAADMFNQIDKTFVMAKVQEYAEGLKTTEVMVLQNFFINDIAQVDAAHEIWGFRSPSRILKHFMTVQDDKGMRMLTGEELYTVLKDNYKKKDKRHKENLERLKQLRNERLNS